jgi:hypothetical protein
MKRLFLMLGLLLAVRPVFAESPESVLASIKSEASGTPGFQGFSATHGETFFKAKQKGELSCSSCHTDNPSAEGKHAKTGKIIKPLAPSANAERFTDIAKVEKWFKRNCNDVIERACTPQEKGDLLAYLLSIKK